MKPATPKPKSPARNAPRAKPLPVIPRASGTAIIIGNGCHCYGTRGALNVYIWHQGHDGKNVCATARIPWTKLLESAARCRPESVVTPLPASKRMARK